MTDPAHMASVLILGARSDIGLATAHAFAAAGHDIQLAARNAESLEPVRADLEIRHSIRASLHELDALAPETHDAFLDSLPALPGVAVSAIGLLGDQVENARDMTAATRVIRSNFEGPANLLALLANRFEARGSGTLVGIGSVAGERGRATNYVYGAAKAGFAAFLSGLRNRLAAKGVHVVTVLPGFVATRMTEGMDLPKPLTARPEEVARAILTAAQKGRDIVYVRPVWRLIMAIIRNIPERIFKRMKL